MFKKAALFLFISFLLAGLAFWSPWTKLNISILKLLGLKQETHFAGLQVYSLQGEIEVLVDDEVIGTVNVDGSPLDIFDIDPGPHMVTIRRSDDTNKFYYEVNKVINFVEGVNTVIAYELGPSQEYSAGYIIYATSKITDIPNLSIRTSPEDCSVFLNGEDIGTAPIVNYKLDMGKTYSIIVKHDGYEDIEFNLLPEDEKERELLSNYDINVDVNLFAYPLDIKFE